jgi:hypothetical protein
MEKPIFPTQLRSWIWSSPMPRKSAATVMLRVHYPVIAIGLLTDIMCLWLLQYPTIELPYQKLRSKDKDNVAHQRWPARSILDNYFIGAKGRQSDRVAANAGVKPYQLCFQYALSILDLWLIFGMCPADWRVILWPQHVTVTDFLWYLL